MRWMLPLAETGLGAWGALASRGDEDLFDPDAGSAVRWSRGDAALLDPTAGITVRGSRDDGWVEVDE